MHRIALLVALAAVLIPLQDPKSKAKTNSKQDPELPAGRYSLHAWTGNRTKPVRQVTVTPGQSAFVEVTLDGEPSAEELAP